MEALQPKQPKVDTRFHNKSLDPINEQVIHKKITSTFHHNTKYILANSKSEVFLLGTTIHKSGDIWDVETRHDPTAHNVGCPCKALTCGNSIHKAFV